MAKPTFRIGSMVAAELGIEHKHEHTGLRKSRPLRVENEVMYHQNAEANAGLAVAVTEHVQPYSSSGKMKKPSEVRRDQKGRPSKPMNLPSQLPEYVRGNSLDNHNRDRDEYSDEEDPPPKREPKKSFRTRSHANNKRPTSPKLNSPKLNSPKLNSPKPKDRRPTSPRQIRSSTPANDPPPKKVEIIHKWESDVPAGRPKKIAADIEMKKDKSDDNYQEEKPKKLNPKGSFKSTTKEMIVKRPIPEFDDKDVLIKDKHKTKPVKKTKPKQKPIPKFNEQGDLIEDNPQEKPSRKIKPKAKTSTKKEKEKEIKKLPPDDGDSFDDEDDYNEDKNDGDFDDYDDEQENIDYSDDESMAPLICKECQEPLKLGQKFCPGCARELPEWVRNKGRPPK